MFDLVSSLFNKLTGTVRKDGFANPFTNIGMPCSRTETTRHIRRPKLTHSELTSLYEDNGLAKRVVSIIVDDAVRDFIHCELELKNELDRTSFKQNLTDAAIFGRLYGGALLVCFVDDGRELYNSINFNGIKKIISLRYYDRYQVTWTSEDLVKDFLSEHYMLPEIYTITPESGVPFRVHRSRCHLFCGDRLPNQRRVSNMGWHNSVLQAVYTSIRDHDMVMSATSEVVQDCVQSVLKIEGLADKLISTDGEKAVNGRLNYNDQTRSVSNTIVIDAETEDYIKLSSSLAGIPEICDRHKENITCATGIPITKLVGRSPSGLNAKGHSDQINWDNIVNAYRVDEIEPCIDWYIQIAKNQTQWSTKPKSFEWTFPSLVAPDPEQQAKINLLNAQIDQIYIDRGGLDAQKVASLRYANGEFQQNIELESEENASDPYDVEINEFDEPETQSKETLELQRSKTALYQGIARKLKK